MDAQPLVPVGFTNIGPVRQNQAGGLFDPAVQRRLLAAGRQQTLKRRQLLEHWKRILQSCIFLQRARKLDAQVLMANWDYFKDTYIE